MSKIGINEDYICENNVGDHGVYDSKNFKLDEVKFVEDIDIDKEKFYDIYSKYIVDVINVIKRNPYMRVYVTADSDNISKVFDNQNVQAKFKNFLKGGDNLDGSNKIVLKTFLDLLRCYSVDDLINNNDTIKKELENGVFDIIKENRNAFSEEDRKNINCSNWKVSDSIIYNRLEMYKLDPDKRKFYELLRNTDLFASGKDVIIVTGPKLYIDNINASENRNELYRFFMEEFGLDKVIYGVEDNKRGELISIYKNLMANKDSKAPIVQKPVIEKEMTNEDKAKLLFDNVRVED